MREKVLLPINDIRYYLKDAGVDSDKADQFSAIDFVYRTHWEHLGSPSVFKKFGWVNVYSIDPGTFSLVVRCYNDFDLNLQTDAGISFNGDEDNLKVKFRQQKAKAKMLEFSNSVLVENIRITGWDTSWAPAYRTHIKE